MKYFVQATMLTFCKVDVTSPNLWLLGCEHFDCILQLRSASFSQQNERHRLKVAEKHQREVGDQHQIRLSVQQSRDYNSSCISTQKFNGDMKGMCCTPKKLKRPQFDEPLEPLKTSLAGYTVDSRLESSFEQLKPSESEQQRNEKLVPTADVEDELDDDKI
uniref:Uncharacterized protein n=1 Tax=Onchocerca volvulus TaxID=6282 RepID=A0A8R1XS01_ONCVO